MKKFLYLSLLFIASSFAQETCVEISKFSVYCYQLRESQEVKSCIEAEKLIEDKINNPELKKWAKKACQYGCLSESLHEANQMEKFILNECEKK